MSSSRVLIAARKGRLIFTPANDIENTMGGDRASGTNARGGRSLFGCVRHTQHGATAETARITGYHSGGVRVFFNPKERVSRPIQKDLHCGAAAYCLHSGMSQVRRHVALIENDVRSREPVHPTESIGIAEIEDELATEGIRGHRRGEHTRDGTSTPWQGLRDPRRRRAGWRPL